MDVMSFLFGMVCGALAFIVLILILTGLRRHK